MINHGLLKREHALKIERTFRMLLVEDNPADIRLIREALAERGIPVELQILQDGQAAVDWVDVSGGKEWLDNRPDLILLDLNLPKVDGHDVLHAIKNNECTRCVPVIVLSSSSNQTDVLSAYHNQANCYIQKPSSLDEMFRLVHTMQSYWMGIAQLPTRGD